MTMCRRPIWSSRKPSHSHEHTPRQSSNLAPGSEPLQVSLVSPPPTAPLIAEINAPDSWRTVDFISDLHLSAAEPETLTVLQRYLESTPANALFILGDLFDVWVGDDAVDAAKDRSGLEHRCAHLLTGAAERMRIFFMHGNRDFLVGPDMMTRSGTTLLADPTVLSFGDAPGERWVLSHGDALCLDDHNYLAFREQVRSPDWQQQFLAQPLAERQDIARTLRRHSQQAQAERREAGQDFSDVDAGAACQWLDAARAEVLIHGHTHRPAFHDLGQGFSRVVLSDWDAGAQEPRAEVLRLSRGGLQRIPLL